MYQSSNPLSELGYRLEFKYRSHQKSIDEIYDLVRSNELLFEEAFEERQINNIYLDHPSLRSYFHNIDGLADRVKFRVRWYGESGKPKLELKIKKGALGAKIAEPLPDLDLERFMAEGNVRQISDLIQDDRIAEQVKQLEPMIINRYSRKYLVSRNRKVRITLDRDIRYYLFNHDKAGMADPATVVVEVKADQDELADVRRVGHQIPLRRDRFSKYVTALELLFGVDMQV